MSSLIATVPTGTRIARLFRKSRGLPDGRTCDLDRVLQEDGIEVVESECADPGYVACLVTVGEDMPAGILLAPGQSRGRRRFSIAHELAHYHIPTHRRRANRPCDGRDILARATGKHDREVEANDFAVELLMPKRSFVADSAHLSPSIEGVLTLAAENMYDVSVTAAALRYVRLSHEACALICSRNGKVEWVARSRSFFFRISSKGEELPIGSMARFVAGGESANHKAQSVDPYIWLGRQQRDSSELFESTLAIPSQEQVLSLLWTVAEH